MAQDYGSLLSVWNEAIVHNVRALRSGRSVEKLSIMLAKLQRMAIDFLNVVQAAHCSFFDAGALDSLLEPTHRGSCRPAWTCKSPGCAVSVGPSWPWLRSPAASR